MPVGPRHQPLIVPPLWLLVSLILQLPGIWLSWPLDPSARDIAGGSTVMLVGIALNLWADRLFKRWQVGVMPLSPAPHLIEEGPFRFSRNPMYLGMLLICAGVAPASGVLWNLIAAPLRAAFRRHPAGRGIPGSKFRRGFRMLLSADSALDRLAAALSSGKLGAESCVG